MSTHVDGASPSVAPDPDDADAREGGQPPSGAGAGSEWLRAEMQRRMAENRSSRGRHARRGEPQPAARREVQAPDPVRLRPRPRPAAPDPWVTGYASPADLPENYVPRHSVQTPGPAAEPAAPISGPIPVVPPPATAGPVVNGQPVGDGTSAGGPIGGPSLPPTGLPVRRRRGDGPGRPLQGDGAAPGGPWSRPVPIVPNEPARRLGAPPEAPGTAESLQSWGLPLASPPRGFVVPGRPPGAVPADVTGADDAGATAPGGSAVTAAPEATVGTPAVEPAAGDRVEDERASGDRASGDRAADGAAGRAEMPDPTAADSAAQRVDEPVAQADEPAADEGSDSAADGERGGVAQRGDVPAPAPRPGSGSTENGAVRPMSGPSAASRAPVREASDVSRAPTESAVEITGETPTAPHPIVLAHRTSLSGRLVGVPSQRSPEHARAATPSPVAGRDIPIVGSAPPEPGSTRVRVVLSERKGVARPVRTIKEVQEGTAVGELLRRDLIRSQLLLTLRFAALTVLVLGALPAVFVLLPEVSRFHVLGVRLPWLLLGVLMYPFLVGVAWRYTRVADRVEQNFADHVQD